MARLLQAQMGAEALLCPVLLVLPFLSSFF